MNNRFHLGIKRYFYAVDRVESFPDTIISTRDLYIANLSMQMNDTMRHLQSLSRPTPINSYYWHLWPE